MSITTRIFSGNFHFLRRISDTPSLPPSASPPPPPPNLVKKGYKMNKVELWEKLSGIGKTGQKVTDVLTQLTEWGFKLDTCDLVFCLKRLRKYGRYNHCLEILEWMEKSYGYSNYALRLNLLCKVKGIGEAENYFYNLPPYAKKPVLYGVLLNSYCSRNMTFKALALFRKMEEMNLVSNSLVFNNLMSLCMKVDQPEKVPPLVQEMKQRNIPLSTISYLIWLQSYGRLKDLAGVERVMEEVEGHRYLKDYWKISSHLATAYINIGLSQKAALALSKLEELLDHPDFFYRDAYHHLISLSARNGNEDSVFQAWGMLNSKFVECHNQSYLIMLQTLSNLDNIDGLKNIFEEWESRYKSYDVRLPSVAINAYLRHGMLEEAELLFINATSRSAGQKLWKAHVHFMDYFLGKHQIDSALRHMEAAYLNGWKPHVEKLGLFFEYFKQEKDFHGAEKLCNMLRNAQALDSRACLWLLQTSVAAGKELTGMRQRMEEDGINISSEHEELLSKVCRN